MSTTLRIRRFNPEQQAPAPFFQDYELELEPSDSVLDGLIKVRETLDDSLGLRCSCRGAICGSCGMRINGHATLACKTKIVTATQEGTTIRVEPMNNMPVIKDLITDMSAFWDKIRQVRPWLQPSGATPEAEYLAPAEAMSHLSGVMTCIMCGVCVSDCTVLEVDSRFVGPAALAKAYRFVADPRDGQKAQRLNALNEPGGMWDCTRCMECIQVCPKGVGPMDRIMSLRAKGMDEHVSSTCGSRHAEVFTDIIERKGLLDEPMLALRTFGLGNWRRLLGMIPVALQSLRHKKVPPSGPFHRAIPGIEQIKRLFARVRRNP
ncbi:MAG: succinate dehydrogenase iron-sulfur subunit [Nitrospirales bacterium]|nr:succinate dehydrogenase iron-sulfur subunit [Nitrospira sp.]MDR4499977.1 succinate dehydrogenase iron-sulfur subunit [Nitrospirales bacterium]